MDCPDDNLYNLWIYWAGIVVLNSDTSDTTVPGLIWFVVERPSDTFILCIAIEVAKTTQSSVAVYVDIKLSLSDVLYEIIS